MTFRRQRAGFTLIEVLVAMAVLALISVGLLATTWGLSNFARGEADRMVADAYCHDVLWAIYSQEYTNTLNWAGIEPENGGTDREWQWDIISNPTVVKSDPTKLVELPRVESCNILGESTISIPLWRSFDTTKVPRCKVKVHEKSIANGDERDEKTITVFVYWHDGEEWQTHSNVVTRAKVNRKGGGS